MFTLIDYFTFVKFIKFTQNKKEFVFYYDVWCKFIWFGEEEKNIFIKNLRKKKKKKN
jgi:hypothetical protein